MDTKTLLQFALENKPVEFKAGFQEIITDKISTLIDKAKPIIAQTMFEPIEPTTEKQD